MEAPDKKTRFALNTFTIIVSAVVLIAALVSCLLVGLLLLPLTECHDCGRDATGGMGSIIDVEDMDAAGGITTGGRFADGN